MTRFAKNFMPVALLASVCSTAGNAADVGSGAQLYKPCAVCHGAAGEGSRAMYAPKLAGRENWYLERQLTHFRSGVRGAAADDIHGQQMANAAIVLWDQREVRDVVAFLMSLPGAEPERTVRGKTARGKDLYAICAGCHGPQAEGSAAISAPRLAGLKTLPDEQALLDVAAYINTLD